MRYVSKPTEIEAMQWVRVNGTDSANIDIALERANRIVAWVNANGGEARYEHNHQIIKDTCPYFVPVIAVRTINGWAYAAPGHYVVMGSEWFEVLLWMPNPSPHARRPDERRDRPARHVRRRRDELLDVREQESDE